VKESVRMTEDRDKWRKYIYGVANRKRTEQNIHVATRSPAGFIAAVVYALRRRVCASVCLSVCLSPAGIVSKRLDGLRCTMRYEQIDK